MNTVTPVTTPEQLRTQFTALMDHLDHVYQRDTRPCIDGKPSIRTADHTEATPAAPTNHHHRGDTTMLTEKQRDHARRNALQDAPAYAKGRTVTLEKIAQYTDYQAGLIAPRRQPAYHQWKGVYRYHFTAYMINAEHLTAEEREQARAMLEKQDSNTPYTTIRAGKDDYGRSNVYAVWQTNGTWYSAQIWQAERGQPLDRGEAINVQAHATKAEAVARQHALANPEPPAPKVQVTKDGPAYLLPGIEPAGKQKGDTEQLAMF